jgi:hypothetical protein
MRSIYILALALSLRPGLAWAEPEQLSPFYSRHRLIAGAGDPGFRDGNFVRAAFQKPMGLAVSPDGTRLYVADNGNHAIRSIDLAHQNRVATVCGDGVEGDTDSAGSTLPARLRQPTDVTVTRDNSRLYIYDRGNRKIKAWDLQQKTLSTVFNLIPRKDGAAASLGLLLNADETHLGFIDSQEGSLYVGEIKTGVLHRVFQDTLLAEGGVQLAYLDGHLRLLAAGRNALYAFTAEGKELDSSSMGSLSEGAKVLLKLITETPAGLQGFTGMGEPPKHQGVMTWDADFATFRIFENATGSVLGMPNSQGVPAPVTIAGSAKAFFKGPLSLGYDPLRCMIYVSEQSSNRVVAVRDDSQPNLGHPLWYNHDYPKEKPVGVTRIVMFGCSREFHSNEDPVGIDQFMSTQLELYLNLMSAMQGRGQQFEVVHDFLRGRAVGAGEVWSMEHPEILRDYHADYVLFPMDVDSLWWDIVAWNTVETKDDVPLHTQDAEWAARSPREISAAMGPLTKAMVDYCKAEPKACGGRIAFPEGAIPNFNFNGDTPMNFFTQPHLRDLALQVEGKLGTKIVEFCKKEKIKPIAFILPTKEYMGGSLNHSGTFSSDLAEAHAAVLRARGLPAFDLIDPLRMIEPSFFPLWGREDGHYRSAGIQWVAYMMAWKFLEETGPN